MYKKGIVVFSDSIKSLCYKYNISNLILACCPLPEYNEMKITLVILNFCTTDYFSKYLPKSSK